MNVACVARLFMAKPKYLEPRVATHESLRLFLSKTDLLFFSQKPYQQATSCVTQSRNLQTSPSTTFIYKKHWLTWRYISVTKNLTCVTQTPVWMVESVPGRSLEGISVRAHRDMAERTAQVNTTTIPYVKLEGTLRIFWFSRIFNAVCVKWVLAYTAKWK